MFPYDNYIRKSSFNIQKKPDFSGSVEGFTMHCFLIYRFQKSPHNQAILSPFSNNL